MNGPLLPLYLIRRSRTGIGFLHTEAKPFSDWPHAVGPLQLNPIYKIEKRRENGDAELRFQFPSDWYKIENHGYLDYAPELCSVSGEVMRALQQGADIDQLAHPEVAELISKFVLLGMPARYLSA